MKKLVSFFAIAAMILVAGACNKQEQPDDESGKMSDLQYLIDGLVRTDDAGNITGYIVGDSLNEANPWEISVPVNNYDEAVATFRDLLPDGAQVTTSGKTLIWTMTDEEGKPEGTAEFAEDPGLGAIAAVTLKPVLQADAVKQVSPSVHFILTSAWPQNAGTAREILEKDYYIGATVTLKKNLGYGDGEFLVIRTWKPTEAGIMVRLVDIRGFTPSDCCTMGTMHKVYRAIHDNYTLVDDYRKQHGWPSFDRWYRTTSSKKVFYNGYLSLETDETRWSFSDPEGSAKAYVYFFGPDGDKVEYW